MRHNNAASRVKPEIIVFAGLPQPSSEALLKPFSSVRIEHVSNSSDVSRLFNGYSSRRTPPLIWGRDRIGIGLLKALRSGREIVFKDITSPAENIPSRSGHLVVCEEGNELSDVIAANYAFALNAGLCVIPQIARSKSEKILERFYSIYEIQDRSPTEILRDLTAEIREICGPLQIPKGGSITFISDRLPYGVAFPEVPSTHLFRYPDLGICVVNGLACEQPPALGIGVAVLVDPETTDAPEIAAAAKILSSRGILTRGYRGRNANVRNIDLMIEHFPYDLLIIATHCGDASGYRWTYEFTDSEGIDRHLVVDVAISLGHQDEDGLFKLKEFIRFHSLDGVDWNDPDRAAKLYVGKAMTDYVNRKIEGNLQPTVKEEIPRVIGSAALKMFDHNYLAMLGSIANAGTPIILNNACTSWHELAGRFVFGNARAYIGTLFPVATSEAHDVAVALLSKHFGKSLAHGLWSAQRAVYGNSTRRPYVVTGVYPQRLRSTRRDVRPYLYKSFLEALIDWRKRLAGLPSGDGKKVKALTEIIEFHLRELQFFRAAWLDPEGD